MSDYRHVLIATDLFEGSEAVIRKAKKAAENVKLSLIHVVEPLPGYGYAFVAPIEIEATLVEQAKKQLAALGKKYEIPSEHQHVLVGPVKMEILDFAAKEHVDLIIVGSHGRHGLGLLLGSTANGVIHGATCDVLTVRLKDKA